MRVAEFEYRKQPYMIYKRTYEQPTTRLLLFESIVLLTGSETTLPTDPTDGTDEALSKGNDDFWDED